MPYWNVLTNVAIAKIAKYLPSTLNDLRLISEVPPSQARKYSDKIFECVDMFVEKFERELREKRRVEESKRVHDPLLVSTTLFQVSRRERLLEHDVSTRSRILRYESRPIFFFYFKIYKRSFVLASTPNEEQKEFTSSSKLSSRSRHDISKGNVESLAILQEARCEGEIRTKIRCGFENFVHAAVSRCGSGFSRRDPRVGETSS